MRKEYILSEKAEKALGKYLVQCFYIWDHRYRIDNYYKLGITCLFCGKKTDNKYYWLQLSDFGEIEICIECFENEIQIKEIDN